MNVVRHPASEALFLIRTITAVRPKMKIRTRVSDGEFKYYRKRFLQKATKQTKILI